MNYRIPGYIIKDGNTLISLDQLQKSDTISIHKNSKLVVEPAPVYNRNSKFQRVRSWLHYILFVSKTILSARSGDAILLVSNPPLLGGWVWLLTRINKIPYAVLVYDIHPEVLVRLGVLKKDSFIVKLWHAINRLVFRNSELVITIGKRMVFHYKIE